MLNLYLQLIENLQGQKFLKDLNPDTFKISTNSKHIKGIRKSSQLAFQLSKTITSSLFVIFFYVNPYKK